MKRWGIEQWILVGLGAACAVMLLLLLSGCSLFTRDKGADAHSLTVSNKCKVQVRQMAGVAAKDGDAFAERIKVSPDCTAEIFVEDLLGEQTLDDRFLDGTHATPQVEVGEEAKD